MSALRRYTFKLYPSAAQAAALERQRLLHCWLYNALLQQRIEAYQRQRKSLTYFDQCKEITALRADDQEYRTLSRSSMDATAQRLDRAYQAFFRRAKAGAGAQSGFPRFRASALYPSIPFKAEKSGWAFDIRGANTGGHRMRVQGIPGLIRARGKLPAPALEKRSCEILWREGAWWLSLVTAMEPRRRAGTSAGRVEFDLIDSFAVVRAENGERLAGLEHPQGDERRISVRSEGVAGGLSESPSEGRETTGAEHAWHARAASESASEGREATGRSTSSQKATGLQQRMANCRRGSNRYRRLRALKARIEAQEARRRRERLHVWTTALQRHFGVLRLIVPQSIKDATATGRGDERNWGAAVESKAALNRRVLDQAPAMAVQMLEYKFAESGGRCEVEKIPAHPVLIGNELRAVAKVARRARRKLKEAA